MITECMERVRRAISRTPKDYWIECLGMRSAYNVGAVGPTYRLSVQELDLVIMQARWEPYEHPEIQAPVVGFTAPIPGTVDFVDLHRLAPDRLLVLEDLEGTGQLSVIVELTLAELGQVVEDAAFTVMLLGPSKQEGVEQVLTFHPGPPMRSSTLPCPNLVRSSCPVGWAIQHGLDYAEVRVIGGSCHHDE